MSEAALLDAIRFDPAGLVTAVARAAGSGEILMVAWMNREAVLETARSGQVCYFSRSRGRLWRKGEQSGQTQRLIDMRVDCDGDTLLLTVEQEGVACHTGRRSCFYRTWNGTAWVETDPVVVPEDVLYGPR